MFFPQDKRKGEGGGGDLAGAECEIVSGGLVHVHTPCAETDSKQFLLDLYCIPFEIFDLVKGGALEGNTT